MEPEKEKQLIIDFHETFDGPHGKRVMARLSKICHENEPCIVPQDALGTAYNEGARSVILHIRAMLAKNPHEKRQEIALGT